jgi:hypothetical protein
MSFALCPVAYDPTCHEAMITKSAITPANFGEMLVYLQSVSENFAKGTTALSKLIAHTANASMGSKS